jgi:hypothetical protein
MRRTGPPASVKYPIQNRLDLASYGLLFTALRYENCKYDAFPEQAKLTVRVTDFFLHTHEIIRTWSRGRSP